MKKLTDRLLAGDDMPNKFWCFGDDGAGAEGGDHPGLSDSSAANTQGMAGPAGTGETGGDFDTHIDDKIMSTLYGQPEPAKSVGFFGFDNAKHGTPGIADSFGVNVDPSVDISSLGNPFGSEDQPGPDGPGDWPNGLMHAQQVIPQPPSILNPIPQAPYQPQQNPQMGYWQGNQFIFPRNSLLG